MPFSRTEKEKIRSVIASRKRGCSSDERKRLSASALQALEANECFQQARCVLLYHSLPDEVQTHAFISKWCKCKQIVLPVVAGDELELRLYAGDDHMQAGSFHILEPDGKAFTEFGRIDVAVIPGVAFDERGNRLGRGKGYYDRLLAQLRTFPIYKIGICFPFQIVENIPAEVHDVPMDEVIS